VPPKVCFGLSHFRPHFFDKVTAVFQNFPNLHLRLNLNRLSFRECPLLFPNYLLIQRRGVMTP
jgi:hypothetical protein